MKIEYFPETDSLCIDLAERPGADTRDFRGLRAGSRPRGHPVGIDIDQALKHLDLRKLNLKRIPFEVEHAAG